MDYPVERRAYAAHCPNHEERTQQVAAHEAQIQELKAQTQELFGLTRKIKDDISSIKLCVERNALKMDAFGDKWSERVKMSDDVIAEYREAMVGINKKFEGVGEAFGELKTATANKLSSISSLSETALKNINEKIDDFRHEYHAFDWFRIPLNDFYKAAPRHIMKWAAIGIGIVIVVVVLIHQVDITRLAKAIGIIK